MDRTCHIHRAKRTGPAILDPFGTAVPFSGIIQSNFQVVCPQNGTAIPRGLTRCWTRPAITAKIMDRTSHICREHGQDQPCLRTKWKGTAIFDEKMGRTNRVNRGRGLDRPRMSSKILGGASIFADILNGTAIFTTG